MKKLFLVFLLVMLGACSNNEAKKEVNPNDRYSDMIDLINDSQKFMTSSEYFDLSYEVAKINDGYSYYIFIDNPKIALYNIEALALEDGVDYKVNMASNVGIFEDKQFTLLPGQADKDKGYVKGLMLSGVSSVSNPRIKLLVQWQDKSLSETTREYFEFTITNNEVAEVEN